MNKHKRGTSLATSVFSGVLAVTLVVQAQDTPTTEPAKSEGIRLEQPYGKIPDLTDQVKSKIEAVHKKALADIRAIHSKEEADIRALLTDDQNAELDKIIAEKREQAAEKSMERKEKAPATAPTGG